MKTKKDAGTGGSGTGSSGAVMAPGENTYDPSGNEMNKHADAGTKP